MKFKNLIFALLLISTVFISACSTESIEKSKVSPLSFGNSNEEVKKDLSSEIIIEKTTVKPLKLTINKGDSVIFINNGNDTVSVYNSDEFKYTIEENRQISHIFERSGTYNYLVNDDFGGVITVN